jgi:DNA polymerase-3 subunit chi
MSGAAAAPATRDAFFYQLTARPLEAAAPEILEKCLELGWRVTVRAGSRARVEALSALLWTYREDSFLPHGDPSDPFPERQPVYLTDGPETPNDPQVLMLVDGADPRPGEIGAQARLVLMFDGHDEGAVAAARAHWKAVREAGLRAEYWAHDAAGRWVRKAASG